VFPATFFDFNGVLVNDESVHFETFREVLLPLGVSLSEQDYLSKYLGYDDAGAFTAVLKDAGRTPNAAQITELIEAKRPLYMRRARQSLPTFAGAAELVGAVPRPVRRWWFRARCATRWSWGSRCWACAPRS
jgi:beta-phosphoglucomutase-like phosphatase (HAD superfamily)